MLAYRKPKQLFSNLVASKCIKQQVCMYYGSEHAACLTELARQRLASILSTHSSPSSCPKLHICSFLLLVSFDTADLLSYMAWCGGLV